MMESKFRRKEAFQMLSIIKSAALMGIDSYPVSVEVIGESTKATNGSNIAKDYDFVYNKKTLFFNSVFLL